MPVLLAALVVGSAADPLLLLGQDPLSAQRRRDLDFGDVIAGIPTSVSRLDNRRSGMYEVRGQPDAEVSLTFTLPAALTGFAGATLAIEFGPDDAGFAQVPAPNSSVGFDPRVSFTATLSPAGWAYLWLGGTVRPGPSQASGPYQSPVTLTVAYTGN